jgi:hypothetical protein
MKQSLIYIGNPEIPPNGRKFLQKPPDFRKVVPLFKKTTGKCELPAGFRKSAQENGNCRNAFNRAARKIRIVAPLSKERSGKCRFPARFSESGPENREFLPTFQKQTGKCKFPPRFLESGQTKATFRLILQKRGPL